MRTDTRVSHQVRASPTRRRIDLRRLVSTSTITLAISGTIDFFQSPTAALLVPGSDRRPACAIASFHPAAAWLPALAHIHAPVLRLPGIDRMRAHPNLAGHILALRPASICLTPDHLRFRVLAPRHRSAPSEYENRTRLCAENWAQPVPAGASRG